MSSISAKYPSAASMLESMHERSGLVHLAARHFNRQCGELSGMAALVITIFTMKKGALLSGTYASVHVGRSLRHASNGAKAAAQIDRLVSHRHDQGLLNEVTASATADKGLGFTGGCIVGIHEDSGCEVYISVKGLLNDDADEAFAYLLGAPMKVIMPTYKNRYLGDTADVEKILTDAVR